MQGGNNPFQVWMAAWHAPADSWHPYRWTEHCLLQYNSLCSQHTLLHHACVL